MILRYIGTNTQLLKQLSLRLSEPTPLDLVLQNTPFDEVKSKCTFLNGANKVELEDLIDDEDEILILQVLGGG